MATVAIAAHTSTQHSLTNPNQTQFPSAIQMDATNVASPDAGNNSIKRLFGVSDEFRTALPEDSVSYVQGLSNEELFPLGEKALRDIADDLVVLCEIRQRFYAAKVTQILGYDSFRQFVEKNSAYSVRTIQRRLSEVNGKDQTRINDRFKVQNTPKDPATTDALSPHLGTPTSETKPLPKRAFKNPAIDQLAELRGQFPGIRIDRVGGSDMTEFQVWIDDVQASNAPEAQKVTVEMTTDQLRAVSGSVNVGANGLSMTGVKEFLSAWGVGGAK